MEIIGEVNISVRNLIEFILRSGDIDIGYLGGSRAQEGIKAHKKIQKMRMESSTPLLMMKYEKEVLLKYAVEYKDFLFNIEGRADGIIIENNSVTIEEIKTTTRSLDEIEDNLLHWAQAKCYGFIYSKENNIKTINIKLTYYNIRNENIKSIDKSFEFDELKEFFYDVIHKYYVFMNFNIKFKKKRNKQIKSLVFPFKEYREGQRKLAVSVYKTISENKNIFIEAPTGIGKTISTIFPSIKAIGEEKIDKIFYLTAKNTTRDFVLSNFKNIIDKNISFKVITLISKEKICLNDELKCNPDKCEFAKGHFDRINESILDILNNENIIDEEVIKKYSLRHKVCPFEFSLDISLWCDGIICDYNYAFDPRVYLRRFFSEGKGDFVLLIDEAHNLLDRSREMFSSTISKESVLNVRKSIKDKNKSLYRTLGKINKELLDIKKLYEVDNYYMNKEKPEKLQILLSNFTSEIEILMMRGSFQMNDELLNFYFEALYFLKICDMYGENYITYGEEYNGDFLIKLFAIDTSKLLNETLKKSKSSIFFSGTLSPTKYFREVLGGENEDYILKLNSPFSIENHRILIGNNISTKYKNRCKSYDDICNYINTVCKIKKGNYMVFFPSYKYMNEVCLLYKEKYPEENIIVQNSSMDDKEREQFIKKFDKERENTIGFCVLGGIFSEGIDLTGDKIIGAIIVGVGLPQICVERNLIKNYYDDKEKSGFEYSYIYPGMTKVMQAGGRVIRTEKDRGIILLIDERFNSNSYKKLFPKHWFPNINVKNEKDLEKILKNFWD
ncbi:ATP-dependent DNA helicase [Clostridium sp. Marseille-Q2269]|uniref:ATP-dependent DNA helicase n=1 Tax=Clostridium sp. Marseille-Q2269 TaxID=2942205 RepID=UPI0020741CC7|nr:ATP-dependent DNA helicase [Clostridium sp. Marseille-Q2269]